jgi:adenine-specific DNA-methyltransferase
VETPETKENPTFLTRQLLTYIGSKRALLDFIGQGLQIAQKRLGRRHLAIFDVFSGSGIAARYFKQYAALLLVNDLERYSALCNRCYLSNQSELDMPLLRRLHGELTGALEAAEAEGNLRRGLIADQYAPQDPGRVQSGERVFYTPRNARYIDTARQLIGELDEPIQPYFLAPLLSEASVHANTAGVFKGFYKNRETGIGQYGGKNQDALLRITGAISLPFPVFSNFDSDVRIYTGDANAVVRQAPEVDVAYLDPPYNQHPYGSNYFMLNLILDYRKPERASPVSGIPADWNRSNYNKRRYAVQALARLITDIKTKFLLISFNSEGFITPEEMRRILDKTGKVETLQTGYTAFRGSRNLRNRNIRVKEYMYVVEK